MKIDRPRPDYGLKAVFISIMSILVVIESLDWQHYDRETADRVSLARVKLLKSWNLEGEESFDY